MAVRRRSKYGDYQYDFQVQGVRYRGRLPGARTRSQALVALALKRDEIVTDPNSLIDRPTGSFIPRPKRGMLYAVQIIMPDGAAGPIKIGFTRSVQSRVRRLNTCGPYAVQLLGSWSAPQGCDDEKRAHEQFAHLRLLGEWFLPAAELLTFIEAQISSVSQTEKQPPALVAVNH